MYHQWFNTKVYGEKEEALINAIKDMGSKPIKYGEQPEYEEKIAKLKSKFNDYIKFCEEEHKKEMEKQEGLQR